MRSPNERPLVGFQWTSATSLILAVSRCIRLKLSRSRGSSDGERPVFLTGIWTIEAEESSCPTGLGLDAMGNLCNRCLPFLPFFSLPEWRRFELKIRGKEFGLKLPAECTQVASGDHRLAVFEGWKFDPELVDVVRLENPELCFVPILKNRRLVVGDGCIPAGSRQANILSFFFHQLTTAEAQFRLGHRWMCSTPGRLYVSGERKNQFHPDLDVTDAGDSGWLWLADRELQAAGSEDLEYCCDLPKLLAMEVMAEGDDPGDIDRKCTGMVEAGAARIAVGIFVWDPARPGEFDGTVKVYRRSEGAHPESELRAEAGDPDRDVVVEVHPRTKFVPLDGLHKCMRLYMPTLREYALLSQGRFVPEPRQALLNACCDVRDPERVKEAINYLASLNSQDSNGRLCMVEAAKAGDVSLLDYMHQHGASLGGKDAEGVSPYLAARAHQRAEACEWLEERGCLLWNQQTTLERAIRSRKTRVVEYLLLAGESEKFAAGEQCIWSKASLSEALSTAYEVLNQDAVRLVVDKASWSILGLVWS